ncbi:hypothetical protein AMC82_PC00056 (plasmid) [Rhizobium phaseoli]|uniref:Uncharacterized protein n=1 Tax=Rhizobium phaseoli TaxID=396 RepID=A0ABM6CI29_9HYPH|nr:hypothetical protein AMC84_PC00056 [Rhizobium phaseoli]ANL81429.1 hypothetical protein AMC82_PC00056 [Rhizobium phaseoli]ANL87916.1 hypothetical protein AMC81_PD00059 [Rhizobium phaseoli]ANL94425.1 hypothetical protein AMC80_PD00059 [Rhizobium phaseoli]
MPRSYSKPTKPPRTAIRPLKQGARAALQRLKLQASRWRRLWSRPAPPSPTEVPAHSGNIPIRAGAQPIPSSPCPSSAWAKDVVVAIIAEPAAPQMASAVIGNRHPKRSKSKPTGTCIAAKPAKNAEDRTPNWKGDSRRSRESSGPTTAKKVLKKILRRKLNENATKVRAVMLLDYLLIK